MKKIFVVLAVLFIGILLAGCTSQPATPVATPTPTEVPTAMPTEVPTAVVTTVVPTTVATPDCDCHPDANTYTSTDLHHNIHSEYARFSMVQPLTLKRGHKLSG